MQNAIEIESLGKSYCLGRGRQQVGTYRTLRESLVSVPASLVRRIRSGPGGKPDEKFWALRDVSFHIAPGEVVGIIGRNGAGKSTLLKILSRITKPSAGRIEIHGRVGSLLEVGTGFHPELTGRENIFLNGSILGMSRGEIARRFDEIVAFAEIEDFLDTPVKRYSSGMYVRLAFAVAAHLEPEILVIDEVLAVGDFAFQKKCLGKMREVGQSGRTVLFVSHNMAALESLCSRCVLIDRGRVIAEGETRPILTKYYEGSLDPSSGIQDLTDHRGRLSGSVPIMSRVVLCNGDGRPTGNIRMGSSLSVRVDFDLKDSPTEPHIGFVIKTDLGTSLFGVSSILVPNIEFGKVQSTGTISGHLEKLPLMPGTYTIDLYFTSSALGHMMRNLDTIHDAIAFEVIPSDVFGSGKLPPRGAGPIFWPAKFDLQLSAGRA